MSKQELNNSFIEKKPHSKPYSSDFKPVKKFDFPKDDEKVSLSSDCKLKGLDTWEHFLTLESTISSPRGKSGAIDVRIKIALNDFFCLINTFLGLSRSRLSLDRIENNEKFLNLLLKNSEAISKISPQKSMEVFLECLNVSTKINSDNSAKQTQNVSESIEQLKILQDSLVKNDIETATKINNVIKNLQNK